MTELEPLIDQFSKLSLGEETAILEEIIKTKEYYRLYFTKLERCYWIMLDDTSYEGQKQLDKLKVGQKITFSFQILPVNTYTRAYIVTLNKIPVIKEEVKLKKFKMKID